MCGWSLVIELRVLLFNGTLHVTSLLSQHSCMYCTRTKCGLCITDMTWANTEWINVFVAHWHDDVTHLENEQKTWVELIPPPHRWGQTLLQALYFQLQSLCLYLWGRGRRKWSGGICWGCEAAPPFAPVWRSSLSRSHHRRSSSHTAGSTCGAEGWGKCRPLTALMRAANLSLHSVRLQKNLLNKLTAWQMFCWSKWLTVQRTHFRCFSRFSRLMA